MKKVLPYFFTSIITSCFIFVSLYLYNTFVDKEESIEATETVVTNVNITESESIQSSVKKVYDAVVLIETYDVKSSLGTGTGFVYKKDDEKGYILTNYHVIEDANVIKVTFTDGETYIAELLGCDEYSDVAVLSVDVNAIITVAEIGSSEDSEIGDTVFTIGSPLGSNYMGTVTKGILSGKDRQVTVSLSNSSSYIMEVLQTDAAINPGNSGGPLLNINGQVIGINSLKLVEDQIEGMGFAIPIELVMSCVDSLEKGQKIERPYLGVETISVTNQFYLRRYNITVPNNITFGAVIINIESGAPISDAGLKTGDIILYVDDNKIEDSTYLKYAIYKHQVGDKVKIKYYRDGKTLETEVLLDEKLN